MTKNEMLKTYKLMRSLGYYPRQLAHGEMVNDFTLGIPLPSQNPMYFKPSPNLIVNRDIHHPMVDVSDWYPSNSKINGFWNS